MKKIIKNYKLAKWILISLGVISVLLPIALFYANVYIWSDSTYFLNIVEGIYEGYVPYVSIGLGYTPIYIYLLAFLKVLFGVAYGHYKFYLTVNFLFSFFNSYLIYKISRYFNVSKRLSLFGSWLYLIMIFWLGSYHILLETPSTFFGLLSCLSILKFSDRKSVNFLWIGLLSALAFGCKQFGLGYLFLGLYLTMFYSKERKVHKVFYFFLGYIIPILIALLIWGEAFVSVVFSKYGTVSAIEAGYDSGILTPVRSILKNLLYFSWRISPFFIPGLLFVPTIYEQGRIKEFLFALFGIIGFSLQYYFKQGGLGYFLYMIPFAVFYLLIISSLDMKNVVKRLWLTVVAFTVALSIYSAYYNVTYKLYNSNVTTSQKKVAKEVMKYVDKEDNLYIVHGGLFNIYYFSNIHPPKMNYSHGPLGMNNTICKEMIDSADYVLRFSADYPFDSFFTDSIKFELEKNPFIVLADSTVLLHKMK